jgi:hypothetical protein
MPEIESCYQTMILESRRVTGFVNDFVNAMDALTTGTPGLLLKTYFAYEGVNLIMLTLVFMLNKFLRLAEPADLSLLNDDAGFLSAECLKAARRSYQFKPLGASLTPLGLGVAWASTADLADKMEAAALLEEFKDDLLGSKFVKLAAQLQARYEHVGRKLSSTYEDHDYPFSEYLSPAWIASSEEKGDAAGCCIM